LAPYFSEGQEVTEHAVVIAGGGVTAMALVAEQALAKVDGAVGERRPAP
jgi:hypothetical protein